MTTTTTRPGTTVGPWTKGLRLDEARPLEEVRAHLAAHRPALTDALFSWPLLTIDADALDHNLTTMARIAADRGALHAPHAKTHMSPQLAERQLTAGAWGLTVADGAQLRAVLAWELPALRRVVVANELVDARDLRWLCSELARRASLGRPVEVLVQVDSARGIEVIAGVLASIPGLHDIGAAVPGILVELGASGGRAGARSLQEAEALGRLAHAQHVPVRGVSGYEGSVARGCDAAALATVRRFVADLRELAGRLVASGVVTLTSPAGVADEPAVIVSAGGSAYLDVVLDALPGPVLPPGYMNAVSVHPVVRAGAYLTHDDGLLARANPWSRMPAEWRAEAPRPALRVHTQVLSTPEQGLAVLGAGRRHVPYDIDLPVPLGISGWAVTKVDDQHAYLRHTAGPPDAPTPTSLQPGQVITLGLSHPCTVFDKWRTAVLIGLDGRAIDVIETQL
ncbi:alanine racemase [Sanguibacter sp. A247]|uniref:alanine racemase n=1 Tax=unclassified Sanguibacter TaxID=2645534 RepID=UPI003FD72FDD